MYPYNYDYIQSSKLPYIIQSIYMFKLNTREFISKKKVYFFQNKNLIGYLMNLNSLKYIERVVINIKFYDIE
jgi:hypothetical protein